MIFAKDFRVLRRLAEGGMGAVYVVEQCTTGHQRALKLMHPQVVSDPRGRERFAQEARIGSLIKSAHVVEVTAAGVDEATGTPWLAMELLEGEDLAQLVRRRGALPPEEVREIFEQLGDALGMAHRAGIMHLDLKPENVFIATSRLRGVPFVVKVLDFGISKIVAENKTAATVTSTIGSPLWLAPEQAHHGAKLRPATDVWAMGLIAFYLLTGRYYWRSANVPDDEFNLTALLTEIMVFAMEPASVRASALGAARALPQGFDAWFACCLAREAEVRFGDAALAVATLIPLLSGFAGAVPSVAPRVAIPSGTAPWSATEQWSPPASRPSPSRRWVFAGLVLLAVTAGVLLVELTLPSPTPAPSAVTSTPTSPARPPAPVVRVSPRGAAPVVTPRVPSPAVAQNPTEERPRQGPAVALPVGTAPPPPRLPSRRCGYQDPHTGLLHPCFN